MATENLTRQVQRLQLGPDGGRHRKTRKLHASSPLACSSDRTTFALQREATGQFVPGFQVAFGNQLRSSDLLAAVDEDGMVSIIDTSKDTSNATYGSRTGVLESVRRKWRAHENAIFDVIWSHDDTQLLTASGDLHICGWDTESQRAVFKLQGHHMSVKCVRQVPEHAFLFASGSRDGTVLMWDTRVTSKPVGSLVDVHGSPSPPLTGSFSSSSSGTSVFVSPPGSRKRRRSAVRSTPRSVTCLEFAGTGYELVTAGAVDSVIKFWDFRRLTRPTLSCSSKRSSPPPPRPTRVVSCLSRGGIHHGISSLAFDQTRTKLLVNVLNDAIKVIDCRDDYDGTKCQILVQCTGHLSTSFYVKAAFSPESDFIIGGSADGSVYLWDASVSASCSLTNTSFRSPYIALKGHTSEVNGVAWNNYDFTRVASCSDDGTVRYWEINRHQDDAQLRGDKRKPFVLERNTSNGTWRTWKEYSSQPDGFAYTVSEFVDDEDVMDRNMSDPERKSPILIRRSDELVRRSTTEQTPRHPRSMLSSPQTLLDFWKR